MAVRKRKGEGKSKTESAPEYKMVEKLARIERLLEDLIALQGCAAGANRHLLAKSIGVAASRVSALSTALKTKEKGKGTRK